MSGTAIVCPPLTKTYTMHQRMLDAAICAYAVTPHGFNPDCKYWAPIQVKGTAIPFQGGSSEINAGFIATTEDDWVVLSLRGTLSGWNSWDSFLAFIRDWLNDDKTRPVPMYAGGQYLGKVHKGFYESSVDVWSMVSATLYGIDWTKVKGLQITGHSKGAGMCFIMAAMARLNLKVGLGGGPKVIEVNAYAAPLAGDPTFAASYKSLGLDATTTRHQRAHDVVPFLPAYISWNIFDHLTWEYSRPESLAIYTALELLGDEIYSGYELVGSLIFYPNFNPVGPSPETGTTAIINSRAAIVAAVKYGDGNLIGQAHSAVHSYWPALFQTPNPALSLDEMTAEVLEKMECEG